MTALVHAEPAAAPLAVAAFHPGDLLRMVVQNNAPLETIEKFLDLQDRWEKNEARKQFNAAMSAFRANHIKVVRSAEVQSGPMKGMQYARLSDFVEATAEALAQAGLSVSWRTVKQEKEWIEVACIVRHAAGHEEETVLGGPIDNSGAKNAIQARASTVTYLKKYTMKMALGLAEQDDDDDGNGGPENAGQQRQQTQQQKPAEQEFYPDDKFSANFDSWVGLIESGKKTAEKVIATVEAKGLPLTEEQKKKITGIKQGEPQ